MIVGLPIPIKQGTNVLLKKLMKDVRNAVTQKPDKFLNTRVGNEYVPIKQMVTRSQSLRK